MRIMLILALCLAGGCQGYTQRQMALVDQARKGLGLVAQGEEAHQELLKQVEMLSRKRLDEAFDEDVRQCPELTASWVIEHRRGYAAGLDALALQRSNSEEAARVRAENLKAIDQAMQRLYWLQSVQLQWFTPQEGQNGQQ